MAVFIIDDFTLFLSNDYPSLIPDPRDGVVVLYSQSNSAIPNDDVTPSSFTKFDGIANNTIAQISTRNTWGSFGICDIDDKGNLFAQSPGILTFAQQRIGRFTHDTLALDIIGTHQDTSEFHEISGDIRIDRHSIHKFVSHWTNSDTGNGLLTVFDQKNLVVQYEVARATFGLPGASRRVRDADFDTDGNQWVLISDANVNTEIWKVTPGGTATQVADLSGVFPGAVYILWVSTTNRLILGRQVSGTGLWLWDINTQLSVGTGLPVTLLGGLSGVQSFHNPKMNSSLWTSSIYLDGSVPVPPGSLPYFPQFTEINIDTFTVVQTLQFPETSLHYPVRGMGFYFNPINAIFSPEQNAIFSFEGGGQAVGKFIVGPPPPPPLPPPIIIPNPKGTSCDPITLHLNVTDQRTVSLASQIADTSERCAPTVIHLPITDQRTVSPFPLRNS